LFFTEVYYNCWAINELEYQYLSQIRLENMDIRQSQDKQQYLFTFQSYLDGLRERSDLDKIKQISKLSNIDVRNIALCQDFAFLCISKLANPATHPTFKRPIFYAIDAILKEVPNGPYSSIFSRLFAEHGPSTLMDIPMAERPKMANLFKTWNERKFFPVDLLDGLTKLVLGSSRPHPQPQPQLHPHHLPHQPQLLLPQAHPHPQVRSLDGMSLCAEVTANLLLSRVVSSAEPSSVVQTPSCIVVRIACQTNSHPN
jgi:hypothetical protein